MLQIAGPVRWGTLVARRNRFVAEVELDGGTLLAHVPTSSRMRELLLPGAPVLVALRAREGRVTAGDLLMARAGETLVSVDSRVPNRLLERVFRTSGLPEFAGWGLARCEVTLGESRLDFLLAQGAARCWVEAKSVTLVEDGAARFPDAPTARGARHLGELAAARVAGDRAAVVFIIQRDDADRFAPHRTLDPVFADALAAAHAQGVEVYAYTCRVTPAGIAIARRVDCDLG